MYESKTVVSWLPAGRTKSTEEYKLFYQATKTSTQQVKWPEDEGLRAMKYTKAGETMTQREKLQKLQKP